MKKYYLKENPQTFKRYTVKKETFFGNVTVVDENGCEKIVEKRDLIS